MTDWFRWQDEVLLLDCYLKPGARETGVLGLRHGRLHVQVKAPPTEGKANTALCDWLAGAFDIPRRRASLRSGKTQRYKTVALEEPARKPDWFIELSRQ